MATERQFEFDVFISYSSKDKAWVRGDLLKRIEKAGLRVCIDYRDFRRGAPSVIEMERAVECCRKTLLILTPNYVASEWTEFERTLATCDGPPDYTYKAAYDEAGALLEQLGS